MRVRLGEGAVLRGRVLSSAGATVAIARVRVSRADAGFRDGVREAATDDLGNFEIEGLEREALEVVAVGEDALGVPQFSQRWAANELWLARNTRSPH